MTTSSRRGLLRELLDIAQLGVEALVRGATALERIADALESGSRRRTRCKQAVEGDPEITDTDRAAARAAARRLGLDRRRTRR